MVKATKIYGERVNYIRQGDVVYQLSRAAHKYPKFGVVLSAEINLPQYQKSSIYHAQ